MKRPSGESVSAVASNGTENSASGELVTVLITGERPVRRNGSRLNRSRNSVEPATVLPKPTASRATAAARADSRWAGEVVVQSISAAIAIGSTDTAGHARAAL